MDFKEITLIHNDKIYHHSKNPIESFDDRSYIQSVETKPRGVWFSFQKFDNDKDDWEIYCIKHNINLDNLSNKIRISLYEDPEKPYIYIKNGLDVLMFQQKFGKHVANYNHMVYIDWDSVSNKYSGIIVYEDSPFSLFEYGFTRYHTSIGIKWLDKWGVYSGCVWDPKLIKILKE